MKEQRNAFAKLASSMAIFGSIGIFVRYIPLDSSLIALIRAVVGVAFLLVTLCVKKITLSRQAIRVNLPYLCCSGVAIGFNWILLFESYRHTSVAVSTLCYYMAPIIVILLSPILLKEKLSGRKVLCVVTALTGMVFLSGIISTGISGIEEMKGILLGLGAAVLYASAILMNKKLQRIGSFDRTVTQLSVAALVLLPYTLFTMEVTAENLTIPVLGLLAVVGVVHTGVAYFLYFGSMEHLSGQTIAIGSYIDPVVAVIASVVLLREPFSVKEGIGAVLILGAAIVSELPDRKKECPL